MSMFCNPLCGYLSLTEELQDMIVRETGIKTRDPHICLKYNKKLEHRMSHPHLFACDDCLANNDNERRKPE